MDDFHFQKIKQVHSHYINPSGEMNPLGNTTKEVMVEALHIKGMIICTYHARGLWKAMHIHALQLLH